MESRPFYVIIKNTQQLFSEHQCISLTEKASLEKILLVLSTSAKRHMYLMFTLKKLSKEHWSTPKSTTGTQYREGSGGKL
jgi:hypothetical protein